MLVVMLEPRQCHHSIMGCKICRFISCELSIIMKYNEGMVSRSRDWHYRSSEVQELPLNSRRPSVEGAGCQRSSFRDYSVSTTNSNVSTTKKK
jgi:hypothetical protein